MVVRLQRVFPKLDRRIIEIYARSDVERLQRVFGTVRNIARFMLPPTTRKGNCLGNVNCLELVQPRKKTQVKIFFFHILHFLMITFYTALYLRFDSMLYASIYLLLTCRPIHGWKKKKKKKKSKHKKKKKKKQTNKQKTFRL